MDVHPPSLYLIYPIMDLSNVSFYEMKEKYYILPM